MKRKQLVKQEDDSSSDYTYSEDELPRSRSKKMRSASTVKRERDELNPTADSDSEDFQGCGKEQSLRAMKQTVVDWIRQAYMVGEQGWTAKADIFDDYLSEWARLGKEAQLTAPAFGRLVHRAFPGIKSCRMGPRIRARHCYKGLIRRDSLVAPSSSSAASSPFLHSAPYSSSATSPVPTSSSVSSPASSSPIQLPNHHLPEFELQGHIDQQVLIDLDLESELATHGFTVKEEPHTEEDEDDLLLLQQYQYQYQQQQQQQQQQEAYYQPSGYPVPVVKQEMHFYPQPTFHHQHQQQQQQLQEAYAPQPHAGVYMSPAGSFHHHHQHHQVPAYYSPSDVSDPGCTSSTSSSPAMSSAPHDLYSSTTLSSSSSFPAYTSASTAVPPYYAHQPYSTGGWTYPTPAGEAVLPATYTIPPLLAVSAFGAPSASTNTPGSQLSLSSSFSRAEFLSSFFDA